MSYVVQLGVLMVLAGVAWLLVDQVISRRASRPSAPPQGKFLTYGHPWAPVPALQSKLPEPPDSHRWEIKVTTDDTGKQWLHLTLVQIPIGTDVATKRVSLTQRRSWNTYAHAYREYAAISKDIFWNDLIGPVTDWAQIQVNKLNPGTTEYRMG